MNLTTALLFVLSTVRIVVPGIPAEQKGTDGTIYKTPIPYTYSLSMSLASSIDPKGSGKATMQVPAGIKAGRLVQMAFESDPSDINIAQAAEKTSSAGVVKNYWGSSEKIAEGQPLIGLSKGMDLKYKDLPKASLAYWPDLSKRDPPVPASAIGRYSLTTNYCGGGAINIGKSEDFLPAIELADIPANPDLEKPITLTWKPVEGAEGYFAIAQGGNSFEIITWSSSAASDFPDGLDLIPVTSVELKDMLTKGILMPAKQTSCTIPAGTFKDSPTVMITILALAKDRIENVNGINVRILRRSLVSVPISIKQK